MLVKTLFSQAGNIAQKVHIVVEHYRSTVANLLNGKAKAMVVVSSRKEAVRWQLAINKYIEEKGYPLRTLVAFSGEVNDKESGPEPFKETSSDPNPGLKGRDIREAFKEGKFQILLVANKFQTGFDQPLLCGMYVDKRLARIQAVQTLSRLNRSYPGKEVTYVLDFVNEPDDVLAAFKTNYTNAELSYTTDPNIVLNLRAKLDATGYYDEPEIERGVAVILDPKAKQSQLESAITPVRSAMPLLKGVTVETCDGNDTVYGSEVNDNVPTGNGNDFLFGMGGNDVMDAGSGDDFLFGSAGRDVLIGGPGRDLLRGQGSSGDFLTGGPGIDVIDGGAGTDRLVESFPGSTSILLTQTQLHVDSEPDEVRNVEVAEIWGGNGGVTIDARSFSGSTLLYGGAGADRLFPGNGNDQLFGMAGDDTLDSGGGNDWLLGAAGRDVLRAGDGDDVLRGQGSSGDRLIGGAGADRLDGGGGRDAILFDTDDTVIPDVLDILFLS